ncbi:MAG: CBS domain-containing protein [Deltaproteobacteria bacterium]|nr:CBS domain-containing protein [Deltaproteobacteria bacterium]
MANRNVIRVNRNDSLEEALLKMGKLQIDELPVVRTEFPDEVLGMISKRDIITYYQARSEADQD